MSGNGRVLPCLGVAQKTSCVIKLRRKLGNRLRRRNQSKCKDSKVC